MPEAISSTIVVSCQSNCDISKHVSFWPFKVNFGILKAIIELWTCDQQVTAKRYIALKQLFIYLIVLTTISSAVSGKNHYVITQLPDSHKDTQSRQHFDIPGIKALQFDL